MKVEKTKLFKKWLFTYLFLISISLVFIYSIHTIYERSMKEDLSKLNKAYIEQVVNLFDDQFKSIDQLVYTIGFDTQFINIINLDKELSTSNRYEIRDIMNKLGLFSRSNSLVERIDLYAQKPLFIIGGSSTFYHEFMGIYTESSYGIKTSAYQTLMEESYSQKVLRLKDWYPTNGGANPLIYLQTLPIQFQNNPKGALMVVIDEEKLETFGRKELLPNGKLLVFNNEKQLIYANDQELYGADLPIEVLTRVDSKEISIDGVAYIKDTINTAYKNWSYVSLVPKEIYFVRIRQVRLVITTMVALFFLMNIFIAYFFTNRMYLPMKKMVNSFKNEKKFSNQSEYEYIESVINKDTLEQERMKRDLYLQRQPLKNAFFSKLLRGYVKDLGYIEEQLEHFDLFISNEGFQVLLIQFPIKKEEQSQIALSQFIIHNIFEEILSNYFSCQVVELESMVACIINYDQTGILMEELESHLTTALKMIRQEFNLDCIIGVSRVHTFVSGISNAYQESLEAVSHARMLGDLKIIYYEDTQKLGSQYEFSSEHEYRLIHFIKIGDLSQTLSVIDEVINRNTQDHLLKLGYMQCLMFDLMGAIIKSINHQLFNEMLNEKDPVRRMIVSSNIDEMKAIVVEIATIACEVNGNHFQSIKKFPVEAQINVYIEAHYSDADLNVSKLGEVFNMTPAYLSKLYKSETGNSILYALNKVRIDASKKLLEETDLSINEISEKVGYLYCNAFIRFFKNQTGITPGQYKQLDK